jgi:hypothetical protein
VVEKTVKELPTFFSKKRFDVGEVVGEVLRKDGALIGHVETSTSPE